MDDEEDKVLGGTVFEAAGEDRVLGSWSGGSGGTEEGSPVLRFFGPRGMGLVVVSSGCLVGSEAFASCAVAAERFPVTRLRGPDEAGRAAALEDRFMGPETGPRRGAALEDRFMGPETGPRRGAAL